MINKKIVTALILPFTLIPNLVLADQSQIVKINWSLLIFMYLLAFIFGFSYRFILKRLTKGTVRGVSKNINKSGRLIRLFFGIALLALAAITSWSPILIFFSGFCVFESIFSWCGFYAAIGKNTCPIN